DDADMLAERAVRVAVDHELAPRLAAGALVTAERTSLQNGVLRLVEVYEESLTARVPGRRPRLRSRGRIHAGE
ncbi:MAG: hypothetical protein NTV92_09420, partial [Candidatus Bipolaricaulota bacterium]|nr:hypothetical protein [Candidatus Bipolaricaulota bacterium]